MNDWSDEWGNGRSGSTLTKKKPVIVLEISKLAEVKMTTKNQFWIKRK